jgi:hypothetical protein
MSRRSWLFGIVVLALGTAVASGVGTNTTRIEAVPIATLIGGGAGPPRYLRSDAKGNVYLLDGKTLEVFRVSEGAPAKALRALKLAKASPAAEPIGFVADAALCADGDTWVLLAVDSRVVHVFVRSVQEPILAPDWLVTGVACAGGRPAVAVSTAAAGPPAANVQTGPPATPDLVHVWTGEEWRAFVPRIFDPRRDAGSSRDGFLQDVAASQIVVGHGRNGSVWVAQSSYYAVRHVSSGGRVLTSISTGPPRIVMRDRTDTEIEQLEAATRAAGQAVPRGGFGPTPQRAILGVGEGMDGLLYLLVEPRDGRSSLAIDRYNPVELRLERVSVAIPSGTSVKSFAVGSDGIYVATPTIVDGAWWIPWDTLQASTWEPVKEAIVR